LRADWGLHESTIDRAHHLEAPPDPEALRTDPGLEQSSRRARKDPKDRSDHRHHAIDALAIAMVGPELLTEIGRMSREDREYHERIGHWPRRKALDPPKAWKTPDSFHKHVLAAFEALTVSHRPVKRRLVEAFHEETHYGPVIGPLPRHRSEEPELLYTNRISATALKPNHLRVPEGWDQLSAQLDDDAVPFHKRRAIRRDLAIMEDPSPEKSGIVRDRALRDRLRKCLRAQNIDPDDFTPAQIKKLVSENKLTMRSGLPIKGVVLLRTIAEPVIIPRKRFDLIRGTMVPEMDPRDPQKPHPRSKRVYIGGNNHHVAIRERERKRKGLTVTDWAGELIATFLAARRVRIDKRCAVDRSNTGKGRFIMSLAEGEMIYARRWDPKAKQAVGSPDYFVVCKLDKSGDSCRIHFAPHWDARKASEQNRWDVTPGDLRECGPEPGTPPYKVRVSPLGDVRRIND
jgi:CRISPR-associated endonuclease Csn1